MTQHDEDLSISVGAILAKASRMSREGRGSSEPGVPVMSPTELASPSQPTDHGPANLASDRARQAPPAPKPLATAEVKPVPLANGPLWLDIADSAAAPSATASERLATTPTSPPRADMSVATVKRGAATRPASAAASPTSRPPVAPASPMRPAPSAAANAPRRPSPAAPVLAPSAAAPRRARAGRLPMALGLVVLLAAVAWWYRAQVAAPASGVAAGAISAKTAAATKLPTAPPAPTTGPRALSAAPSFESSRALALAPAASAALATEPVPEIRQATAPIAAPAASATTTTPATPTTAAATAHVTSPTPDTTTAISEPNAPVAAPAAAAGNDTVVGVAADDVAAAPLFVASASTGGAAPRVRASRVASDGWQASLASLRAPGGPRVAWVRYDALRAARALPSLRPDRLEIVAPFAAERIHFVVRADSPLVAIHDIEGRTIDAGPQTGSRALTAASVYRAMFDKTLPIPAGRPSAASSPLQRLRDGSADVAVVIGPWPQGDAAYRLLRLEPGDPRDARAANSFLCLPADRGDPRSVQTLGVVSFLVTSRVGDAPKQPRGAYDRSLEAFASTLCRPAETRRQTEGDIATGRIDPSLRFDIGLPYSRAAQAGLAHCSSAPATAAPSRPGAS